MSETVKTRTAKGLLYLFLILLSALCFTPFLLMLVNATRSGNEIMTGFSLLPGSSLAQNWKLVADNMDLGRGFLNSLFLAVCNTALVSYFSALTAYGLAFYKFPGSKVIFTVLLVFMMVPSQLSLLGFYNLVNQMGLIDTYWPLILPSVASPATVFFLRQYILSVMPKAILEAPRIDGAGELAIFHRIALPIMAPGIATMAIGAFIGSWNSYGGRPGGADRGGQAAHAGGLPRLCGPGGGGRHLLDAPGQPRPDPVEAAGRPCPAPDGGVDLSLHLLYRTV